MPVIFLCIPAAFGEVVPAVTLGGLACMISICVCAVLRAADRAPALWLAGRRTGWSAGKRFTIGRTYRLDGRTAVQQTAGAPG
jgi:hypothetical protein